VKAKAIIIKNKILIFAILFSAIWHIFWLSAFKVVVVPKVKKSVKFSNVSFLGLILEKSVLNVSMSSHERTKFEQKYMASIEPQLILAAEHPALDEHVSPDINTTYFKDDEEFTDLTIATIDAGKIEPGRDID